MFKNPIDQYHEGVVPAYLRYVELSKRKDNKKFELSGAAILAADMLFHFREALAPILPHRKLTRAELNKFHDYDLIGDVFNAHKHGTLTKKKGEILIANRTDIEETIVNTYFPFENTFPRNFYGVMQNRVLIYPTKGGVRDLLEIATNVMNFWSEMLFTEKLVNKLLQFKYEGDDVLSHEQALEIGNKSAPVLVRADGSVRLVMIARYYEPAKKIFLRWGFGPNGRLIAVQIEENAPNAKTYFKYR